MRLKKIETFPLLNSKFSDSARRALVGLMARNIIAVFEQATDVEIENGFSWYPAARGFALTLAKRFSVSLSVAAHVVAALSPNVGWTRNKLDALSVFLAFARGDGPDAIKVSTYDNNKHKAFAILGTGDTSLVRGLKTSAFADNILNPASPQVTIDFHASSIARGIRETTKTQKALSARQYDLIADAYRTAAYQLSVDVPTLQAITWLVWRRVHAVGAHHG